MNLLFGPYVSTSIVDKGYQRTHEPSAVAVGADDGVAGGAEGLCGGSDRADAVGYLARGVLGGMTPPSYG